MTDLHGSLGLLAGLRLISNPNLVVDSGERSWARVRSPGRARRRLKRGFKQNIDVIWMPDPSFYRIADKVIAHPAKLAELSRAIDRQAGRYEGAEGDEVKPKLTNRTAPATEGGET